MNRQIFDMLERQEKEEGVVYQSEKRLRDMICRDFADSESLLRLFDTFNVGIVQLFQRYDLSGSVWKDVIPVRTSGTFSVHKHTLCQIPYFHTHDFYEMVYVLRGNCRQEFEHLPKPLILREKQGCLLRPGVVHAIARCGSADVILKFSIPVDLFEKTANTVIQDRLEMGTCVFQANTLQTDFLIYRLLEENFYQKVLGSTAVENYLSLLFVELARGTECHSSAIMFRLAEYFEEDPRSATLDGFAARIGYSEHYASRLIKRYTGRSFLEVIVSLKMEYAKKLLTETDASILQIAEELGYANASGLHKQFLAVYGMTPNTYRRLFVQENGPLGK